MPVIDDAGHWQWFQHHWLLLPHGDAIPVVAIAWSGLAVDGAKVDSQRVTVD